MTLISYLYILQNPMLLARDHADISLFEHCPGVTNTVCSDWHESQFKLVIGCLLSTDNFATIQKIHPKINSPVALRHVFIGMNLSSN